MLEVKSFVLLLECLQVVVGLGEVGDTNLKVLAGLVVENGQLFVPNDEGAVFTLHNLQARLALAVAVVSLECGVGWWCSVV